MHRLKLRSKKKSIILLVYGMLGLGVIGITYILSIKMMLYNDTQMLLQETIEQGAIQIKDRIEEEFLLLGLTADNLFKNTNMTYKEQQEKLVLLKENRNYIQLGIADTQGNVTELNGEKNNIKERLYFQQALKGNKAVSEPIITTEDEIPVIAYAVPIFKDGVVIKVLVATYRMDELGKKIQVNLFNNEGRTYIRDKNNRIIFCSKDTSVDHIKQHLLEPDRVEEYCHFQTERSKKKEYYVAVPIGGRTQWRIEYTISQKDVADNTKRVINLSGIMVVVISLLLEGILLYILINNFRNKEKVYKLAYINPKTKLYNQDKLIEECKKQLGEKPNEPYTVVYLSIDNFPVFNDMLGETVGDLILGSVADVFRDILDGTNIMYAHLTGEYFALIVHNQNREMIISIIKYIESELQNIVIEGYKNIKITLSAGIYFIPSGVLDIKKSLSKASFARCLGDGKFNKKYSFFDEKSQEKLNNRRVIENDILEALDKKQFEIYYQPKFNLHSKKIIGAEALIRWRHPVQGMISPTEFIPIAEQNGSIIKITEYVMERVCKDLSNWIGKDKAVVPIAINLSQLELYNDATLEYLNKCLNTYMISPKLLEIEITERVALENLQTAQKAIAAFKQVGMTVAMDDFGVGYSTTSYMKYLPFDTIKIDKSLIDGIEQSNKNKLLLQGIVDVIRNQGFHIIAEGVENTSQIEKLAEMKVECAQGYVFAMPMNREDFEKCISIGKQV
ncbi:MAG: EAL domain-containing protein [Cellulosilyticaceae bacterium]